MINIAPTTRSQRPQTPLPQRSRSEQADIIERTHFYNTYDERKPGESINASKHYCTNRPTMAPRTRSLGSKAYRRTRQLLKRLGHAGRQ
jgi:hypothetical protein